MNLQNLLNKKKEISVKFGVKLLIIYFLIYMKILKKNYKYRFIKNIIYNKNIKKKNISKFNVLFIKLGLIKF